LQSQDEGELAAQRCSSQLTGTLLARFVLVQLLARLDQGKWGKKGWLALPSSLTAPVTGVALVVF